MRGSDCSCQQAYGADPRSLNAWDGDPDAGDSIWNDVILHLPEYDEQPNRRYSACATSADRFAIPVGDGWHWLFRYDPQADRWIGRLRPALFQKSTPGRHRPQ